MAICNRYGLFRGFGVRQCGGLEVMVCLKGWRDFVLCVGRYGWVPSVF
jgi:hypothetical protein